jgi:hypothetical protein
MLGEDWASATFADAVTNRAKTAVLNQPKGVRSQVLKGCPFLGGDNTRKCAQVQECFARTYADTNEKFPPLSKKWHDLILRVSVRIYLPAINDAQSGGARGNDESRMPNDERRPKIRTRRAVGY